MTLIYIVCLPDVYEAALQQGVYQPGSLATEGFIHASPADRLTRVANTYFALSAELRVLAVDAAHVTAEIKWETIANGDVYPHIYGPLNMDAVIAVYTVMRQPDGVYNISI